MARRRKSGFSQKYPRLHAYLSPMGRTWMAFGEFLHRRISPVMLGIVYFLFLFPWALVYRCFHKDTLNLKGTESTLLVREREMTREDFLHPF